MGRRMDEEQVVARAQRAWDEGRHDEAGRILSEYLERHPERAEALKGRGFAGPGDATPEEPAPPPPAIPCLRCDADMPYRGRLRLHTGGNLAPFLLGDLGELFVDITAFELYACHGCGRVEFFLPGRPPRDVPTP